MLDEMQKQIATRKLEVLYGQLYLSLLFSSVLFISLSYIFRDYMSSLSLFSWLVFFLSIMTFRFFLAYKFKHAKNISLNLHYWSALHMFGVLISAFTWGGFILILAISANPTHLSLLIICMAGLSAGAAGDYSFSFYSFIAFVMPLLIPTGILLVTADDPEFHVQGYFILLFLIMMILLLWRLNKTTTHSLSMQFENQTLKILSTKDSLTGINNRRRFDESLHDEWYRASRISSPLSLILCDIDNFKEYNDTYGHLEGDKCLIRIAHLIEDNARRTSDMAARFGGEEFALLLPDTENKHAQDIAEQIRMKLVDIGMAHSGSSITQIVTASFGVCTTIPDNDHMPESLIECADSALYQAKDQGRNMVVSQYDNDR